MIDEMFPSTGSSDPDDLAAMVSRVLIHQGHRPKAKFRVEAGSIVAIEVWLGDRPVAIFPCSPMSRALLSDSILSVIERGGT